MSDGALELHARSIFSDLAGALREAGASSATEVLQRFEHEKLSELRHHMSPKPQGLIHASLSG